MHQQRLIGGDVSLTLDEVRQREKDAKLAKKQNDVLAQWYYALGKALEKSGGPEPDFSSETFHDNYFIVKHDEEFIESVIGDQLKEYGLVLTTLSVSDGYESGVRVYIGAPGEFDHYKR
jgi:hypothetical protein